MKRTDLIRTLEGFGWELVRYGRKHDWYTNPNTGMSQAVPHHREIKEHLAKQIIRLLGNPPDADDSSAD